MRLSNRMLVLGGMALAMCLSANNGLSQENQQNRRDRQGPPGADRGERPNFDPAQMRERMMERYKEVLEITDDAEWNAIKPKIDKVTEARMATFGGFGRGGFGGARRGGDQGGDRNAAGGARFGGMGGSNPEVEALQKAIDAKASNADMKTAVEKAKDARKAKQAELEKAQDDLRKVLSVRQEALAMLNGLL